MASTPYLIVINNHQVWCDSAESVVALLKASTSPVSVAIKNVAQPAAAAAAPAATPAVKGGRKRGVRGRGKKTSKAAKATRAPKASSGGITDRSKALLAEFARSGGSILNADRLSKGAGLRGAKGIGGALAALARDLRALGFNIDDFVLRSKTDDGTVWQAAAGFNGVYSSLLARIQG